MSKHSKSKTMSCIGPNFQSIPKSSPIQLEGKGWHLVNIDNNEILSTEIMKCR